MTTAGIEQVRGSSLCHVTGSRATCSRGGHTNEELLLPRLIVFKVRVSVILSSRILTPNFSSYPLALESVVHLGNDYMQH